MNMSPAMLLVDVHCHLEMIGMELEPAINRAQSAGVKAIITAGTTPESNRQALEFAAKFPVVKASLGIYPLTQLSEQEFELELKFMEGSKSRFVAVGEIGLDYKHGTAAAQIPVFERQLSLAEKLGKPAVIHSRQAEAEVLEVLSRHKCKAVLHCFHGSISLVKKAITMGCFFSIPANIVRSDRFQRLVKEVPLHQLLTETDAPFLAPEKDTRSEPAMVLSSVRKIAEIKGLSEEDAANIIFSNYQQLFAR
jgi:TatD DNase family protein